MKDIQFYRSNPWYREDDISYLRIYDAETGVISDADVTDGLIEAPNWSKDGFSLYYNERGRMVRFDLESREKTIIDSDFADNCNNDHVLSPDGKRIAISHGSKEDGRSRVYTMPISGGVPKLITPLGPSYLHGWSPDGKTLAYCAERNGEFDIYAIPADGGTEKKLTDSPGLNDGPEYSPDGKYIWYNSVRSGLMQVWRMKCDGSDAERITFDDSRNCWFPHVSPDGRLVSYLAYRAGSISPSEHLPHRRVEIMLMNSDGSGARPIRSLFGGQGTMNVNSWSPDSRRFAFVEYSIKGIGELE